jgi:leader peptidase (prepilin peptidase) / N-methyltransferase
MTAIMIDLLLIPYVVAAFTFGLVIGSFLNVVIYRVPARRTLMGRSNCPHCGHQIRAWDNIPVASWVILGARCRDCRASISWRYPAVELATALTWAGLTVAFGLDPILPLLLIIASICIALFMIDFDTMTLPNVLTYPAFIITALYLTVLATATDNFANLANAGLGALIFGGFFLLLYLITRGRGLGFGDVKLAPTLGALIGWFSVSSTFVALFAAFTVGALPAGILMATGIVKRGTAIPFGPMLIAGAWIGLLFGLPVWSWYTSLTHLG